MSKQREALKIALEVLDSKHNFNSAEWRVLHYRAFQVIREALAVGIVGGSLNRRNQND